MGAGRVLLGMSGGVDSTFAAVLLKRLGYEVEGAVLVMSGHTDVEAARRAAREADVPLRIADCRDAFRRHVVGYLIKEYSMGRTPNPCVACNRNVKIEMLRSLALESGFGLAATGHYSEIKSSGGRYYVRRAADTKKDQSYVLWSLTQEQLSGLLTPLGGYTKERVREEARAANLSAVDSAESQEICFIPDRDYAGFIEREVGRFPEGDFIDENGKKVGRHKGIIHYTVGQRKGLGLSLGRPAFVTAIDPVSNAVYVCASGGEYRSTLRMNGLNFQALPPVCGDGNAALECFVKIRYAAQPAAAQVVFNGGEAAVSFREPVRAVTPGQSAVAYDADGRVLFGGVIL